MISSPPILMFLKSRSSYVDIWRVAADYRMLLIPKAEAAAATAQYRQVICTASESGGGGGGLVCPDVRHLQMMDDTPHHDNVWIFTEYSDEKSNAGRASLVRFVFNVESRSNQHRDGVMNTYIITDYWNERLF